MEIGFSGVVTAYIFQIFVTNLAVKTTLKSKIHINRFKQYFNNNIIFVNVLHRNPMFDLKNRRFIRSINRISIMHEYRSDPKHNKRRLKKLKKITITLSILHFTLTLKTTFL